MKLNSLGKGWDHIPQQQQLTEKVLVEKLTVTESNNRQYVET